MKNRKEVLIKSFYGLGLLICLAALSCKRKDPDGDPPVKGDILWERSYGGSGADSFETMIATPDGGYLLGGTSSSGISGDKSEQNFGSNDYWVIKIDKDGNKLWDRTFGGSRVDALTCLAVTADGGYLVGGNSQSGPTGNKTTGDNQWLDFDFWVIKVNAMGETQWEKVFGNRGSDNLKAILPVKDGGYVLAGHTTLPETGTTNGSMDFWVVRIDEQGQKMWDKCYGGSGAEPLFAATTTADDCFLLGGNSGSDISGNKTTAARENGDFWIIKIRPDGTVVWDQTYGGIGFESIAGIANIPDRGYLLTGVTDTKTSTGDVTDPSAGFMDYWIVRIDEAGKMMWEKTIGDGGENISNGQPMAYNGGFLISGYHYAWPPPDPTAPVVQKYSLANLDASGKVLWEKPLHPNTLKKIMPSGQNGSYLVGGGGSLLGGGSDHPGYWIALIR